MDLESFTYTAMGKDVPYFLSLSRNVPLIMVEIDEKLDFYFVGKLGYQGIERKFQGITDNFFKPDFNINVRVHEMGIK